MHIAICDDCPGDIQALASLIGLGHIVRCFPSGEQLRSALKEAAFDLYLLDIYMEGITGLELAKEIRSQQNEALICFISSSADHYGEAFALYAFQYLIKPVTPEAVEKLLCRAGNQLGDRRKTLSVRWLGQALQIPYERILYISSQGHTLFIHCTGDRVERYAAQLDMVEAQLKEPCFLRCHQSYLVNLNNVDAMVGNTFLIRGEQIPISRRYAHVKERYRQSLFEDLEGGG